MDIATLGEATLQFEKYATIVSGVIPQHDINFTAICKDFLPFLCWFGEKDFTGLSSGSNVFMSSKS
jgi:hypothetical protein